MIDFKIIGGRGNFYFLRHGESDGNNALIIQGHRDYPLSKRGIIESQQAGLWFKEKNIDLILHSPLARAKQTALIVADQLGTDFIQNHEDLKELDTGIFTGMTRREVQEKFPGEWKAFQQESWESVPQAERICDITQRAERYWEYLIGIFKDGKRNILSVTHSGILQWLIKITLGHENWMPLFPMSNCGICHLSLNNRIEERNSSYYYEWTHINFHPSIEKEKEDSLFLSN